MTESTLPVLIVSGPPAAGKTTLAGLLARQQERGVHLATDYFFDVICAGYVAPWLVAAAAQNATVIRAAAATAAVYANAAYTTVIDGVVLPWALALYRTELARYGVRAHCVVLLPSAAVVIQRGLARVEQHGLTEAVYRQMHGQFVAAFAGGDVPVYDAQLPLATLATLALAHWKSPGT